MTYHEDLTGGLPQLIDMAGARFEFMFRMGTDEADTVVFRTHMSAGKGVPLHSHIDPEMLHVTRGTIEVFVDDDTPGWRPLGTGHSILLLDGVKHALRNGGDVEAEIITATNGRLAQYFNDAGRPVQPDTPHERPSPEHIQKMIKTSAEYGYWMSTPEESAAITG